MPSPTRAMGAVMGGLFGGPVVGFAVCFTGGIHRYSLGGSTDLAFLAGFQPQQKAWLAAYYTFISWERTKSSGGFLCNPVCRNHSDDHLACRRETVRAILRSGIRYCRANDHRELSGWRCSWASSKTVNHLRKYSATFTSRINHRRTFGRYSAWWV